MNQHSWRLALVGLVILAFVRGAQGADPPRYLALQIYPASGSIQMRQFFFSQPKDLQTIISELKDRIGVTGTDNRHLGFILGPLAFDNTDGQIRELIASGFDTALKTGVAVGFHIDDSMFWGRPKGIEHARKYRMAGLERDAKQGASYTVGPAKLRGAAAASLSQQQRSAKRSQGARQTDWKRNRHGYGQTPGSRRGRPVHWGHRWLGNPDWEGFRYGEKALIAISVGMGRFRWRL